MFGYKVTNAVTQEEGFIADSSVNYTNDGDAEVIVVYKNSTKVSVEKLSSLRVEPVSIEEEGEAASVLSLVPDDTTTH